MPSKLFNVEITVNEKDDLFNRKSKNPIIRKKDGGFLSSYN